MQDLLLRDKLVSQERCKETGKGRKKAASFCFPSQAAEA